MARMTLDQIKASRPKVDRARIDATSEEDIARHMKEDGENPDAAPGAFVEDLPPARIRERIGMTQVEFARVLMIPVATLRNWEGPRPHRPCGAGASSHSQPGSEARTQGARAGLQGRLIRSLQQSRDRPRIDPQIVPRLDLQNDVSQLIFDLNEALAGEADEKSRGVLVRRRQRAFEE